MGSLQFLSALFIFAVGMGVAVVTVIFIIDVRQTRDAVRRNYPVLGRFRYLFSMLGEFFRQYFFAMDREEMPFNRAERDWIERSSKNVDNTVAFGSTRSLSPVGTTIFVNCPFPTLTEHAVAMVPMLIGPYSRNPYNAPSFFQYFRHELWSAFDSRSTCAVERRQIGLLLVQHWRRRAFKPSP